MANNQKLAKKVATKAPKVQGTHKLPKYAQREASAAVDLAPAKGKK